MTKSKYKSKNKKSKSIQTPQVKEHRQHSALLEVPAELRNRIFTDVVCEYEGDLNTNESCDVPELLQTCRQIRDEAGPIFYAQEFSLGVCDFERSPPPKHHWILNNIPRFQITMHYNPRYEGVGFSCIRPWLKFVHRYKIEVAAIENDFDMNVEALQRLVDVVKEMEDEPWKAVKRRVDITVEWMALAQADDIAWGE